MAKGPLRVSVEIVGWKELAAKMKGDELLAQPWSDAMKSAADMALAAWKGASPVGPSGQMRAKMVSKVQARPMPRWAAVRTSATRSSKRYKRYRYPGRQEYDQRSPNRGKLRQALEGAMGRIGSALGTAARAIEAKWRT